MTDPVAPVPPTDVSDVLPSEPPVSAVSPVPPPVPEKKVGFFQRLFTSRRKQQTIVMQNGYIEMVDLIRAIRSHLDRQETVQTSVLDLLSHVPGAMDRQNEVMTLFKQQLENNLAKDQQLTDSMSRLNVTLASMDESQKTSAHTIADLIHRSRESEQLLREVMRRSERRMAWLLLVFFVLLVGTSWYFIRWQNRLRAMPPPAETVAAVAEPVAVVAEPEVSPAAKESAVVEKPVVAEVAPAEAETLSEPAKDSPPPVAKEKKKKQKKVRQEKAEVAAQPVVKATSSETPQAEPAAVEPTAEPKAPAAPTVAVEAAPEAESQATSEVVAETSQEVPPAVAEEITSQEGTAPDTKIPVDGVMENVEPVVGLELTQQALGAVSLAPAMVAPSAE